MHKYLLCFITAILVSSFSYSQMKLNLPSDIDAEEKMNNLKLVLNKTEAHLGNNSAQSEVPADATSFIPGTIMLGLLGDVTFPFGEEFKNYAGTGWSIHGFGGYSILNSLLLGFKAGYIRFGDVETDYGFLEKNSDIAAGSVQYNTQIVLALLVQYYVMTGSCLGPSPTLAALQPFIGFALCIIFKNYFYQIVNGTGINKAASTVQSNGEFDDSSTIFGISPSVGTYFSVSENIRLILSADYYYLFDKADEEIEDAGNINYLSITFGAAYSIL